MNTKKKSGSRKVRLKNGEEAYDALSELREQGNPSFGELVKSLRTCDNISQTELAEKLGISKQHLSNIERGLKGVSVGRAARFAEALGYPIDQFVIAAIEDELADEGIELSVDLRDIING